MEPFACLADWDGDVLDVWSQTQEPFKIRTELARIFELPLGAVRVRVPYVGGGFGSRAAPKYEPLLAALALRTRRPVKLLTDVRGSFLTVSRHAARITIATGLDADGMMIARDCRIDYDTGAYADKGPRVARKGAYRAAGPYRIPNVRARARAVYTNRLPAGAFRGFSTPQVVWAAESATDEIAAHLGEDPLAFRRRHLKQRGEPFLVDDTPLDADLAAGLSRAASGIDWAAPNPPDRGRGVAVACKDGGGGVSRSEATVRLHPDGSAKLLAATVELGQGARTVLRVIVADELGVELDRIRVAHVDTARSPYDVGTGREPVDDRRGQRRGRRLPAPHRRPRGNDRTARRFRRQVRGARRTRRRLRRRRGAPPVPARRAAVTQPRTPVPELGPLARTGVHEVGAGAGTFGSATPFYEVSHGAAEVRVDPETGEIVVERYVSVADVGRALNRVTCEGQDEGAAVMGLGHTLYKQLEFDEDGQLLNGALYEYRVPGASDLPPGGLHTVLLEEGDGPGPGGAKGAGEGGIIPVAPAIANAVAALTGVRIRELPITPERLWSAMRSAAPGPTEGAVE
jgi:CO/xanthine dehydrogenase Mo-binding subunit